MRYGKRLEIEEKGMKVPKAKEYDLRKDITLGSLDEYSLDINNIKGEIS